MIPDGRTRADLLVGYDGSPAAAGAIDAGARLLPGRSALVVHLWVPPFASPELRRVLWRRAATLDELQALIEREGADEAERIAASGVALARAAGWEATPLVHRSYGGEGLTLARLAGDHEVAAAVVGARGLGGAAAVLGSVSDLLVHHSTRPVLVVPHPMTSDVRAACGDGPVVVAWDGSDGARRALATAAELLAPRELVAASVRDPGAPAGPPDVAPPGPARLETVLLGDEGGRAPGAGDVVEAVAALADARGAAVIAVGSRGRSPARRILLGSVAMGLLHGAHRPVLIVPGERPGAGSA
ncbi:universal stress protein [Miltoncostaea marina]|uniref:universal stress protein n=1 Tax=Miltoncostaea marina TaxID=2843215 RepID=UPI001C3DFCA7|nr:universal stress protein [Miltoncostaea marina]